VPEFAGKLVINLVKEGGRKLWWIRSREARDWWGSLKEDKGALIFREFCGLGGLSGTHKLSGMTEGE